MSNCPVCARAASTGTASRFRTRGDAAGRRLLEYPPTDPGGFYLPERLHVGPPEPVDLAGYRIRYGQYKSDPDLRRAHATAPFVTVWDDHEVKNDYAGLIPQPAGLPDFARRRAEAYQAFYEHLPMRRPRGPAGFTAPRIHQRLRVGDLATFHVLDTRQYRDDQPCDDGTGWGNLEVDDRCVQRHGRDRTLLGVQQRDWLLTGLGRSSTRWDLVAQQAMFATLDQNLDPAKGLWEVDSWDGYTADRDLVLDTLQTTDNRGTAVLSGDIHNHLVADLRRDFLDPSSPAHRERDQQPGLRRLHRVRSRQPPSAVRLGAQRLPADRPAARRAARGVPKYARPPRRHLGGPGVHALHGSPFHRRTRPPRRPPRLKPPR